MSAKKTSFISSFSLAVSCLALVSCASAPILGESRAEIAQNIAVPAGLRYETIDINGFQFASWVRMTDPQAPVHLYIEGDGMSWLSRQRPSPDPTPKTPVALMLAAQDPAANIIYLARPCQYTRQENGHRCSVDLWTSAQFSHRVFALYESVLSSLSERYTFEGIHFFGFSGGANIAGVLAAQSEKTLSFRSIAGNIAPHTLNAVHKVTPMRGIRTADQYTTNLSQIPQIHFIGAEDKVVTQAVSDAYLSGFPDKSCIRIVSQPNTTHMKGWTARWKQFLEVALPC